MKHRTRARVSSLFLMELIIAILVFSIASSYCVKVFVSSKTASQKAQAYAFAASECSGIAELVTTADSYEEAAGRIDAEYPEAEKKQPQAQNSKYLIYFDSDRNPCKNTDKAEYCIKIKLYTDENMLHCDIAAQEIDYNLNVKHYIGGGK